MWEVNEPVIPKLTEGSWPSRVFARAAAYLGRAICPGDSHMEAEPGLRDPPVALRAGGFPQGSLHHGLMELQNDEGFTTT